MNETELTVKNKQKKFNVKIKEKILNIINKINFKRIILVLLFLFLTYICTELLSGKVIQFGKLLRFSVPWDERKAAIKGTINNFCKFPKLYNYFILICMYLFLYGITNRSKISCGIISGASMLFGTINYIVKDVRGFAISVSDIYSIHTAANVARDIRPTIRTCFIVSILLFIITCFVIFKFAKYKKNEKIKSKILRLVIIIIGALGIFAIFKYNVTVLKIFNWNMNLSYEEYGAGLTLMKSLNDMKLKKPDGYDVNKIKEILSNYTDDTENYKGNLPNVIVIMNESFADLRETFNFKQEEDNIPYFHKLMKEENVISGEMHSSQYAGGTANVEYEYLTQNTTVFLPQSAMVYQQYITKTVKETVPKYMNEFNYTSYGIHSWNRSGYSRGKVYKLLQFKNDVFKEKMKNLVINFTGYSSDESTYEYVYGLLNNKEKNEKNFSFVVTVQNHLPYNKLKKDGKTYVENNEQLNSYLQFENESDVALEKLIQFLKDYDEDTILLFFGDHQPGLNLLNTYGSSDKYSDEEATQVVPFFIWANYDIEEKSEIKTSTNYLQNLLLDAANMPKDSYTKYVNDVRKDIPVIGNKYYIDKNGNRYSLEDEASPYYNKLKEYWSVVYYQMFDNN